MLNLADLCKLLEDRQVTIIATRDIEELEIAGLKVGPLKKGNEIKIAFWAAKILVEKGYAKYKEGEFMTLTDLSKAYWAESIQDGRRLAPLPSGFYFKLKHYLESLRKSDLFKAEEFTRAYGFARDLIECRIRKILNLAMSPHDQEVLDTLTEEEKILYEKIKFEVEKWKTEILGKI